MAGGSAFEDSKILGKNHMQICIPNFNCIGRFFILSERINYFNTYIKSVRAAVTLDTQLLDDLSRETLEEVWA